MKTVGIITEYNPFHNGHIHHIREALRLTAADTLICVMSGNFVQRGEPAFYDKFLRTRVALSHEVNLVVELPVRFSTSSSEKFAYGAVEILDKLGADYIAFGCETDNINLLSNIADILENESDEYKKALKLNLKSGLSFPVSRTNALKETLPSIYSADEISTAVGKPNSILAIEYIRAIKKLHSNIQPIIIMRTHDNYNSTSLNEMSSATALRKAYANGLDITNYLEDSIANIINSEKNYPISYDDISSLIYYKLLYCINNNISFTEFLDCDERLANRLTNCVNSYSIISDYVMKVKSKDYTYTRIERVLIHILLDIKVNTSFNCEYIRILGADKKGTSYLKSIKKNISVPLITKVADAKNIINNNWIEKFNQDIYATDVYNLIVFNKYNVSPKSDYKTAPIISS